MELKDYQQRVLDTFDTYLDELGQQRKRALQIEELSHANPNLNLPAPDYPAEAWAIMKQQGRLPKVREKVPFSPRKDSTGRAVPNVCFKIPTGGGKTLLAVETVSSLFGKYYPCREIRIHSCGFARTNTLR